MAAMFLSKLARANLACAALLVSGAAIAGGQQLSADVTVKVRLLRGSGACGAVAASPRLEVSCQLPFPKGPLLPEAGAVPYRRVGLIRAHGVVAEPLPVYSDGTSIASWRVVTLDNARYVELTIAW